MVSFTYSPIIGLLTLLPKALTSGVPVVVSPGVNASSNPSVPANLPPCTNLTGTSAPTIPCYTKLQVNDYLQNYNSTSAEVCAPQEIWNTCFLRTVYGRPGVNCTTPSNETTCEPLNCGIFNSTSCPIPELPPGADDNDNNNNTNANTNSSTSTTTLNPPLPIANTTANDTTSLLTTQEAASWYAAFSLYSVQQHILAWSTALNANTSTHAIETALDPQNPNNATGILTVLISRYGLNPDADDALVALLQRPTGRPEPYDGSFGNARLRGEESQLTGAQWQPLLYMRLAQALQLAASDFGDWYAMVEGGAFSVRGLAGADDLANSLESA